MRSARQSLALALSAASDGVLIAALAGRVARTRVLQSIALLDAAAVTCLRQWPFTFRVY